MEPVFESQTKTKLGSMDMGSDDGTPPVSVRTFVNDFIKNKLYKEPNPNAYLATFAKFLIKHKETEFCQKIIMKGMKSFVKNYIQQYDNCKEVPIHFVGSIAFYLKEELQLTFDKYGLRLGNVLRRPIDGLIAYHIANK